MTQMPYIPLDAASTRPIGIARHMGPSAIQAGYRDKDRQHQPSPNKKRGEQPGAGKRQLTMIYFSSFGIWMIRRTARRAVRVIAIPSQVGDGAGANGGKGKLSVSKCWRGDWRLSFHRGFKALGLPSLREDAGGVVEESRCGCVRHSNATSGNTRKLAGHKVASVLRTATWVYPWRRPHQALS